MLKFIKGLFLDDVQEPCVGRMALFVGLILTAYTATAHLETAGAVSKAEAVVRCAPGIIGLLAYCFSRLMECKEFVAEVATKIAGRRKIKK